MPRTTGFYHVQVQGLRHSICNNCFLTVAEAATEQQIKEAEESHRCPRLPIADCPLPKPKHWSE
jgi:hypothetical protein